MIVIERAHDGARRRINHEQHAGISGDEQAPAMRSPAARARRRLRRSERRHALNHEENKRYVTVGTATRTCAIPVSGPMERRGTRTLLAGSRRWRRRRREAVDSAPKPRCGLSGADYHRVGLIGRERRGGLRGIGCGHRPERNATVQRFAISGMTAPFGRITFLLAGWKEWASGCGPPQAPRSRCLRPSRADLDLCCS